MTEITNNPGKIQGRAWPIRGFFRGRGRGPAFLPAALLLPLAGCAARIEQSAIMASWHGEPLDSVVAQWGPPSAERREGGRHIVVWQTGRPPRDGFSPVIVVARDPAATPRVLAQHDDWCERELRLDGRGVVIDGVFLGPGCPRYERADRPRLANRNRPPS